MTDGPTCTYRTLEKTRLYHNNHDGTFTDVAEQAGVTLGNWSTGASFGDYDGDGHLDLFVPGYIHYDVSSSTGVRLVSRRFCLSASIVVRM